MLLRVSELVTAAPEIQELDLNPVMVLASGACVADARVRIEQPRPAGRRAGVSPTDSGADGLPPGRTASDAARLGQPDAMAETLKSLDEIRYALDQAAIVARPIIAASSPTSTTSSARSRSTHAQELLGQDHRIINSGYHPKEFMRDLWRTIARGQVWRGEIRNRAKDGSFYWVDTTIVPFLDGAGKPRQYLAIRSDITARKQAEAQLREQAALTNLGQLAAVVAHEVRNPLAGLRASLQVLERRCADARDRDVIAAMMQRIDDLNDKVEDLLLYARPKPPRLQAVDVGALMRDVAHSARVRDRQPVPADRRRRRRRRHGAGRPRHAARRAAQRHHERLSGGRQCNRSRST